jgi:Zn-dependent peptidase ImmA (M78 family)
MKNVYDKMKKLLRWLNSRAGTEKDLDLACRKMNADIFKIPLKHNGYFVPKEKSATGKAAIFINSRLPARRQLETGFHELTHLVSHIALNRVLFSSKDTVDFDAKQEKFWREKHELEAKAIASIAMLPAEELKNATPNLFDEDEETSSSDWRFRYHLRQTYGY